LVLADAGLDKALAQICRMLSVDPEDWRKVPAFAVVFETVAVVHLAREIVMKGHHSIKGATEEACRRLGVNPKTITSRLYRFREV
jgi:hypothetical protein